MNFLKMSLNFSLLYCFIFIMINKIGSLSVSLESYILARTSSVRIFYGSFWLGPSFLKLHFGSDRLGPDF